MKAREILNLYENTALTNADIFSFLFNYFSKSIKTAGGKLETASFIEAKFIVGEGDNFDVLAKRVKQYKSQLSRMISSTDFSLSKYKAGFSMYVYFPAEVKLTPWYSDDCLFYFKCEIQDTLSNFDQKSPFIVTLSIVWGHALERFKYQLGSFDEFKTKEGLRVVCSVIDLMVKAIRLTPFEK